VYWTDNTAPGAVVTAPLLGGASLVTLSTAPSGPLGIGVDTAAAYTTSGDRDSGAIVAVPLDGGAVSTIAAGQDGPSGVAVDATWVYWTDAYAGTVMRATK
jgi:hypothetical protein